MHPAHLYDVENQNDTPQKMRYLTGCFLTVLALTGCTTVTFHTDLPVIPAPAFLTGGVGFYMLDAHTRFSVSDAALIRVTEREVQELRRTTGLPLDLERASDASVQIILNPSKPAEGYGLSVNEAGIRIEASSAAGVFYAFQTIRQLLPPEIESHSASDGVEWAIPSVTIEDAPRFPYRGMHLDVGRYFFDEDFVKRYIDTMARYKFNRFHWHLTEDQGWRIEIEKYPKLTEIGAWREETILEKNFNPYIGDGIPHGGFYTQDEVREVVAYAAERFVTVIPEIEMPGHATAALASYPEYGCTEGPYEVPTTWGIKSDVFCPSEETFGFLEDVLSEVIDLFPGDYIHIGADEVPKIQWEESALAQAVIAREGLADEDELQSYFIRRIESFLNANGKNLIGWDEILEGGLAPNATVMSWRGMIGGIEAARQGHDVIMTPTEYAYFDFYQGNPETEPLAMNWAGYGIPLDTVYAFEPMPAELTGEEAKHILGAQGNVWTEYISTPEYVEYMVYPRAIALSEVVWSPAGKRSRESFYKRLRENLKHLDVLRINYRVPDEFMSE